ncbi:uncharacterized protein LOC115076253 isoform X2 [Rhinatrema bivittatum]|nr:uncharacterized protein LOC115076253 isoform X2 [Rhinatrema bivittatum]
MKGVVFLLFSSSVKEEGILGCNTSPVEGFQAKDESLAYLCSVASRDDVFHLPFLTQWGVHGGVRELLLARLSQQQDPASASPLPKVIRLGDTRDSAGIPQGPSPGVLQGSSCVHVAFHPLIPDPPPQDPNLDLDLDDPTPYIQMDGDDPQVLCLFQKDELDLLFPHVLAELDIEAPQDTAGPSAVAKKGDPVLAGLRPLAKV